MSTKFSTVDALALGVKHKQITLYEAGMMLKAALTNPNSLAGKPLELKSHLFWDEAKEKFLQSPFLQDQIHAAATPTLSVQKFHSAQAMKATINDAMSNRSMTQQAPKARSIPAVQAPTLIQRGNTVIVDMTPQSRRIVWRGPGGSTLTKVEELPTSPITGQPSSLTALIRASVGLK